MNGSHLVTSYKNNKTVVTWYIVEAFNNVNKSSVHTENKFILMFTRKPVCTALLPESPQWSATIEVLRLLTDKMKTKICILSWRYFVMTCIWGSHSETTQSDRQTDGRMDRTTMSISCSAQQQCTHMQQKLQDYGKNNKCVISLSTFSPG